MQFLSVVQDGCFVVTPWTRNKIRELIQLKITIYTYYYVLVYVYCCQICDHSLRNQFLHLEIYKKERKKKTLSYCFQCFLCSFQLVGSLTCSKHPTVPELKSSYFANPGLKFRKQLGIWQSQVAQSAPVLPAPISGWYFLHQYHS